MLVFIQKRLWQEDPYFQKKCLAVPVSIVFVHNVICKDQNYFFISHLCHQVQLLQCLCQFLTLNFGTVKKFPIYRLRG